MNDAKLDGENISNNKILIVGCGELGVYTATLLQQRGYDVTGARRSIHKLPGSLPGVPIDITRPETLLAITQPAWRAVIVTLTADAFNSEAYEAIYINGLRNVLNGLMGEGVRSYGKQSLPLVIFASSTSIYGQNDGSIVDEQSETSPSSFSGLSMLHAERLVAGYVGDSCVVRFGGIYGRSPGRLVQQLAGGYICPREPVLYSNRIHFEDCCRLFVHLIDLYQQDVSLAKRYLAVDCRPSLLREVMEWLAVQQGIKLDNLTDSSMPVRGSNKRCSNAQLVKTGFQFKYPDYRAGFSETLQALSI